MRILVALTPYEVFSPVSGGAISTVAEGLGRAWAAQGHQVWVATPDASTLHRSVEPVVINYPRRPGHDWIRRAEAKIENWWAGFDWPAYRLYVQEIKRAVRAVEPDCLIVHNDLVLSTLRLPLPSGRVLVHLHNQVQVNRPDRASMALRRAQGAVAVSDFIAADAQERFGAERVTTIHNGVDVKSFAAARAPRPSGAPIRVAYLGRLLHAKGPHLVVQAVQRLVEAGTSVQLTVIGSPTFDPADDHSADEYLAEVVHGVERLGGSYLPHQDRQSVAEELARQDVLVVPSTFEEPFGLVVLEGMAAGCAVVASDIGGLPEAVADAGLLFPPGDVAALAKLLEKLATCPSALEDIVRRGRERAAAHDWSVVARHWGPILESVCAAR